LSAPTNAPSRQGTRFRPCRPQDTVSAYRRAQVFVDIRLPGIHGLERLRRIRDESTLLLAVVMTEHGSVESAVAAAGLGADHCVVKSLEPSDLLEVVRRAIERRERGAMERPALVPARAGTDRRPVAAAGSSASPGGAAHHTERRPA
jgi:DNA-binding NtrC family response regulator